MITVVCCCILACCPVVHLPGRDSGGSLALCWMHPRQSVGMLWATPASLPLVPLGLGEIAQTTSALCELSSLLSRPVGSHWDPISFWHPEHREEEEISQKSHLQAALEGHFPASPSDLTRYALCQCEYCKAVAWLEASGLREAEDPARPP